VFCGIYSEKYKHYYRNICRGLIKAGVPVQSIDWTLIPQEYFDREWEDCGFVSHTPCRFIFHHADTVKLDDLIAKLEKHKGKLLIYTDADITIQEDKVMSNVQQISQQLRKHPNSILFEYEGEVNDRWREGINFGFTACYPSDDIINFFKFCQERLKEEGEDQWDQMVINDVLHTNTNGFGELLRTQIMTPTFFTADRTGGSGGEHKSVFAQRLNKIN